VPPLSPPVRRPDGYEIDTDPRRVDVDAVHRFLSEESYWSPGVPHDVVERSLRWSLCFGCYAPDGSLAGFGRAVTDRAVFAYLADVFVLAEHRGGGLGVWLMETMLGHPDLQGLRRVFLVTADAHGLYERFGFHPPRGVERFMEIARDPGELY
jgi:GNAT superfamily N-acetyltransferase